MKKIFLVFLVLAFSLQATGSRVFLSITKNLQEKAEIVLLMELEKDSYWDNFLNVLARDLDYSGFFKVEGYLFVEDIAESKKKYPIPFILSGRPVEDGIKIEVHDPLEETLLFEQEYKRLASSSDLAHKVNDDIVLRLTGRPGIAQSKVVFVSDATGKYELYLVDYDGENLTQLTQTDYMVHYPRWSKFYDEIIYVSYQGGWPKIMKMDIKTGKEVRLLGEPGLNACAAVSPAADEMAVVLSRTGRPEIYLADLEGKIKRQLTKNDNTDASPSFSPCGGMITFVSDRHGSPQIYTMTRDGFRVRRISYVSGYSTSPSWSPDGRYIAYILLRGGAFGLVIYDVEAEETRVVSGRLGSEDISWAADSRHIVYSDIGVKPSRVNIIDVVTGRIRVLSGGKNNSFSPSWISH